MKPVSFDELRDAIYNEVKTAFPGMRVYDVGSRSPAGAMQLVEIELPAITYSLSLELDYSRVVDELTEVDQDKKICRVTELIPYRAKVTVACHSEFQKEAEELSERIHRHWGHAPCFAGVGCRLADVRHVDAIETGGVYSYEFAWVGWIRLAGRTQEGPLLSGVQFVMEDSPVSPPQQSESSAQS